jgi:hypothetical protein
MTKPDFIIIGAMKSATSTLHTQLAMQSGIFMSTPKEPNYFSDDNVYALGEKWYSSLFSAAEPNDLCGESSTHYTKLPDYALTIERMAKRLKSPKLIYVMRHPVDRLISHYIHQWSQNVIKCDINEAIEQFEELTAYSCYFRQLEPYIKQYGRENVLPIFTEAISKSPQQQLEYVADFIGYQGYVEWKYDISEQNVSGQRIRAFKGYSWIVESKLMTLLRRTFVPKKIRNKIKEGLSMQSRPEIDAEHLEKLITIFDEDLAALGASLGFKLSCSNYKSIVTRKNIRWLKS